MGLRRKKRKKKEMRLVKKNTLVSAIYHLVYYYPTPSNITYFWNFGAMAGLCLVVQIINIPHYMLYACKR